MVTVETVRGPVEIERLGATLPHEHIFVKNPELEKNYPHPEWVETDWMKVARESFHELYEKGISTLVDMTVAGLGRDIHRIQTLSEEVPINIVVATGYYTLKDLPTYFHNHGPGTLAGGPEPLEEMLERDITEGIAGTGVKAGVIKVASDRAGFTPDIERVMSAAAVVHLRTGVPISTHTSVANQSGRAQQKFFRERGVGPESVVIGHCGDTTDLDYLRKLMDNGSMIGLDRFGIGDIVPDASLSVEERTETVFELIELGYSDRILLSHDAAVFSINSEPSVRRVKAPEWHYGLISERVLPTLRSRGVSESTIEQITVHNPARFLTRVEV